MVIVRTSSWWNHSVSLFQHAILCCSAPFSSYNLAFKKYIFSFILHFTQRNLKLQIQSGFWNWIQQLSGFPVLQDVHVISSQRKGGQGTKSGWVLPSVFPASPVILQYVTLQKPGNGCRRNWAMIFFLRLLRSQDLTGKQSCKKTKRLPCVTKSLPVPCKKTPVHLASVQLLFLYLSWK